MKGSIAVVSGWDQEMAGLASLTWPNKQEYCQRHGYTAVSSNIALDRHSAWIRQAATMTALPHHDWVLMLDVDTLIMNQTIKLETFLDTSADMILSYDVNGLNCGSTFIRNTDWARNFLQSLWDAGPRFVHHPSQEQTALAYLLYREPKDRWECVSQRRFNSFLYSEYPELSCPDGEYQPGDFLLHLPALPNASRLKLFRQFLPLVVR